MGDRVEADEAVITIETDKVTHEAKSPVAGAITAIMVEEGDTVQPDGVLVTVDTEQVRALRGAEHQAACIAPDVCVCVRACMLTRLLY